MVGAAMAASRRRARRPSRERGKEDEGESERGRGVRGGHVATQDASGRSAEAGGGRRVAAGAGHALRVLLAGGGR